MKKWICVLFLLLGTVLFAVSCTDDSKDIEQESVPTQTEGTAEKDGLQVGVDTNDGFGPLHKP